MPHAIGNTASGLEYIPNLEKYFARAQKLQDVGVSARDSSLPDGLPNRIISKMVWDSSDLEETDWVVLLEEVHLKELDDPLRFFQGIRITL